MAAVQTPGWDRIDVCRRTSSRPSGHAGTCMPGRVGDELRPTSTDSGSRSWIRTFSSGPVEGNVNRIKMFKRQMYGRASFDLLRKRVLLA
jgi:hypothetical protein